MSYEQRLAVKVAAALHRRRRGLAYRAERTISSDSYSESCLRSVADRRKLCQGGETVAGVMVVGWRSTGSEAA
jgi:hypothetical protein